MDYCDNTEAVFSSEDARQICPEMVVDFLEDRIRFIRGPHVEDDTLMAYDGNSETQPFLIKCKF